MAKTYRDQAVVLKKIEYGEADVILTLFGRHSGVIGVIAKGARRMNSRKSGHIELFNQVDVLLAEGRNLEVINEASVVDRFDTWREDLELISLAYYATDITTMMLAEGESYTYVYDRLIEFYAWLGQTASPQLLMRWYEVQLLSSLGFWSSHNLASPSLNAIALLDSFAEMDVKSLAVMKGAPALEIELERLMREQLAEVLDRRPRTEAFVDRVREISP